MASYEKRSGRTRAVVFVNGKKQSATFNTKSEAVLWAAHKESGLALSKEQAIQYATSGRYVPVSLREILERYRDEITPTKRSAENELLMINGLLKIVGFLVNSFRKH
jgi:hypothetical protein